MTFRDIIIKNFKANIKKYFSYFLCSSFSIMIFFMNSTLLFNKNLKGKGNFDDMSLIFTISMTAVAIFSVFFINYAHSSFIISRNKEFGVYMTLGMTSADLRRIVNIENLIIIAASLFTGFISGIIFSRLFQMIVIKLLDIKNASYSLNYKSFLLTFVVFLAIFTLVIIISNLQTYKLEISELLKKSRKTEGNSKNNSLFGIIGIVLIILSFVLLFIITSNKKLTTNNFAVLIYLLTSFSSVYFIILGFGGILLGLVKGSDYYFNNILFVSEVNYKFKQNKTVLFILTILSAMTVFFVASPIAQYTQAVNIAEKSQVNSIEYAEYQGFNKIPEKKLNSIIKSSKTPLISRKNVGFLSLKYTSSSSQNSLIKNNLLQTKPVISQDIYNKLTNSKLSVPKGKAMNIIVGWMPGYGGIEPASKLYLSDSHNKFEFTILDSVHTDIKKWITGDGVYPSNSGIILNNEDYNKIKIKISSISTNNIGTFHILNFEDWKNTKATVDALNSAIKNPGPNKINIISTLGVFENLKQNYSLFMFVTIVMGLLFSLASGSVLYFKQYTELSSTKEKFYKLYKLGINKKEAVPIIAKELRLTFFTPIILGSLLGFSLIYFMTNWIGGESVLKDFMYDAVIIIFVYLIIQAVFYKITKWKYVKEILN